MLFSTGNNVIDIDIAATKGVYSTMLYSRQRCQCPVCRNFDEMLNAMEDQSFAFLEELGVTVGKCSELWAYEPGEREGTQRYRLLYPVVCKLVRYLADAEEWFNVKKGLSIAIVSEGKDVHLMLDWELGWTHK